MQVEKNQEYEDLGRRGQKVTKRRRTRQFVDPKTGKVIKETIERTYEVGADGKEVLIAQSTRESGSGAGDDMFVEEFLTNAQGQRIVRRSRRNTVTMPNGSQALETVDEEYILLPDGRRALIKRTRRDQNADGTVMVTCELFEVGDDGESELVRQSMAVEAAPLRTAEEEGEWAGECSLRVESDEFVKITDDRGRQQTVTVQKYKKVYPDGKVRLVLF